MAFSSIFRVNFCYPALCPTNPLPTKSLSLVFPFPSFHLYSTLSPPIQWFLSNSLYFIDIPGI